MTRALLLGKHIVLGAQTQKIRCLPSKQPRQFFLIEFASGISSVCVPPPPPPLQLTRCLLFEPTEERAIFSHSGSPCNDTLSVTRGRGQVLGT